MATKPDDMVVKVTTELKVKSDQKPGVKTTEFWIASIFALAGPILIMLKAFGVLDPSVDTDEVQGWIQQMGDQLVIIVGLLASFGVSFGYIQSRKTIKTEAIKATGIMAAIGSTDID